MNSVYIVVKNRIEELEIAILREGVRYDKDPSAFLYIKITKMEKALKENISLYNALTSPEVFSDYIH